MHKSVSIFILLFIPALCIFATEGNFYNTLYRENFEIDDISSLYIDVSGENIKISKIYGNEISIEIDSNNSNKIAEIYSTENTIYIENSCKFSKGDISSINIFVPYDFSFEEIEIYTKTGNIFSDFLNCTNDIILNNESGKIICQNINCDYISVQTLTGEIDLSGLSCSYFNIYSFSGKTSVKMISSPFARSICTVPYGSIQFSIPSDLSFSVYTITSSGTFYNNFASKTSIPVSGEEYCHGNSQETPVIELSTYDGDIILGE